MAQTPKTYNVYTGDGGTRQFAITFPYRNPDEVEVTVDDEPVVYWQFASAQVVVMDTAPSPGARVVLARNTLAFEPVYQFQLGAPFLPAYVDANNEQFLYVLQETNDAINDVARQATLRATAEADRAEAEANRAAQEATDAEVAAGAAEGYAASAGDAKDAAVVAAESSGPVRYFDTYAEADAAELVDGQVVEVFRDETQYGRNTRYRQEAGALVYKPRFQSYSDQPGFGHSKYIRENPLYAEDSNYLLIGPDIYIEDGVDFVIPNNTDVTIIAGTEIQKNG